MPKGVFTEASLPPIVLPSVPPPLVDAQPDCLLEYPPRVSLCKKQRECARFLILPSCARASALHTLLGTWISSLGRISGNHSVSVHRDLPRIFLRLYCVRAPQCMQPVFMLGHLGGFQYSASTDDTAESTRACAFSYCWINACKWDCWAEGCSGDFMFPFV